MAQKVEVKLVDDLDGGNADTVVRFSFDGKNYEIDLSNANAEKFRASLAKYVSAARKTGTIKGAGRSARAKVIGAGPSTAEVREWAKSQGMQVPERGRLSKELMVQFQETRA